MARVPTYQPNQVAPVQITGERVRAANNNGGIAGGLAEGLQGSGESLGYFAEVQARIEEENDDTQARLIAADAGLAYSTTTSEFENLVGGQAREAQQPFTERLTKIQEDALAKATNPRQRRLVEERLINLHGASSGQISTHAMREQKVEQKQGFASLESSYAEQAAAATDPELRDQLVASGLAVVRDRMWQVEGIDPENAPEAYRIEELKYTSAVHGAQIDRMFAVPDPSIEEVMGYIEAYGDEMTTTLQTNVLERLQQPLQGRQSRSDADMVMGFASDVVDDAPAGQAPPVGTSARGTVKSQIAQVESRGSNTARPIDPKTGKRLSSALGKYQFTDRTWLNLYKGRFGEGLSDAQILAKRTDGRIQDTLMDDLMKENAENLKGSGVPETAGNIYLAHFAGSDGAVKLHKASPTASARSVLGPKVIAANPFLANMTAKDVINWAAGKMGEAAGVSSFANAPREWDRSTVYSSLEATAEKEGWNPERTERVREELDRRINKDEGLLREQRADADEAAANFAAGKGAGFTSTSMIPRTIWNNLSPVQQQQYEEIAKANAAPVAPKANGDVAIALTKMAIESPGEFTGLNLTKYRPFLTPGEYATLEKDQSRASKSGATADDRPKIDTTITRQKKWGGVDVDKDPVEGLRVRRYMEVQAADVRTKGKEPTAQDYDRWFREATATVKIKRSLFGIDTLAPDTERRASQVLTQSMRNVIRKEYRKTYGRYPNDAETQEWFERMGEGG